MLRKAAVILIFLILAAPIGYWYFVYDFTNPWSKTNPLLKLKRLPHCRGHAHCFRDYQRLRIQFREITKALNRFKESCGQYPSQEIGLKALIDPEQYYTCSSNDKLLKRVPTDRWDGELGYEIIDNIPVLTSYGADNKPGGTGLEADIRSTDIEPIY